MVAPIESELLITGILSEGVMRERAGGKLVNLLGESPAGAASTEVSPGLAYLQYNAGQENFKRIMASAAVAASRTGGSRYRELRDHIDDGLPIDTIAVLIDKLGDISSELKAGPPKDQWDRLKEEENALTGGVWAVMVAWMRSDARRLDLLGDFVEHANSDLWASWDAPRGNMSRYNVLRAFYQLL